MSVVLRSSGSDVSEKLVEPGFRGCKVKVARRSGSTVPDVKPAKLIPMICGGMANRLEASNQLPALAAPLVLPDTGSSCRSDQSLSGKGCFDYTSNSTVGSYGLIVRSQNTTAVYGRAKDRAYP